MRNPEQGDQYEEVRTNRGVIWSHEFLRISSTEIALEHRRWNQEITLWR